MNEKSISNEISEGLRKDIIKKSKDAFGKEILSINEYADIWRNIFNTVSRGQVSESSDKLRIAKDSKYSKEVTLLKRLYQQNKRNVHNLKRQILLNINNLRSLFRTTIGSKQYTLFLSMNSDKFSDLSDDFLRSMKFFVTGIFVNREGTKITMSPKDINSLYDRLSPYKLSLFSYSIIEFKKYLHDHKE